MRHVIPILKGFIMLRHKITIILTFLLILSLSCITNKNPLNTKEINQNDLLNEAYDKNSIDLLKDFLNNWENYYKVNIQRNIENDTLKIIYDIFNAFYKPFNSSIYDHQLSDSIYCGINYVIIQNKILYLMVDSIVQFDSPYPEEYFNYKKYKHIDPFFPNIKLDNIHILYLTTKYDTLIKNFLGDRKTKYLDLESERERIKRQTFLNNLIKIHRGHWNYGWLIETYPVVQDIIIDKTFTKALIDFEFIYTLGGSYLEKRNNEWILLNSEISVVQ
jgi:hypothetical protein